MGAALGCVLPLSGPSLKGYTINTIYIQGAASHGAHTIDIDLGSRSQSAPWYHLKIFPSGEMTTVLSE